MIKRQDSIPTWVRGLMREIEDDWIADTIGSAIFFIIILSMAIEWDVVLDWFKGE